jgi:hypothetical protein
MENQITKNKLLEELEELLSIVPPSQLRKSIHKIFARYLQTINNETDLEEFKILAEDFYFLNKFLEKVEEEEMEKEQ